MLDSGIGGLSICQPIIARFPQLSLHYLSDNAAYPYGTKSREFLEERVHTLCKSMHMQTEIDAIIVACNTASTVVLPRLRKTFSIPVIGVVPAIKTAAQVTQSNHFALLATPGTVEREYTKDLIQEFASDKQVILFGTRELVDLVESYYRSGNLDQKQLETILAPLLNHPKAQKIDQVVLGCTHFPLIRNRLEQLAKHWQWIDSGPAIAARLEDLLSLQDSEAEPSNSTSRTFWATSNTNAYKYPEDGFFNLQLQAMGFNNKTSLLES